MALRPKWLLAQKRKMQLAAVLMPATRSAQVLKKGSYRLGPLLRLCVSSLASALAKTNRGVSP